MRVREGRESSALALSPRGHVPLDSHYFKGVEGWGASLYRLFTPCLAGTRYRDDRPPTHFFVKKKFIPIGGADRTTKKVPSVFCYARDFLQRGDRCHARNPPAIRFAPGPPPFNKGGKKFLRLTKSVQTLCGARSTPYAEGSFFLYEKSVPRESDCLRGRGTEVCTDLTPNPFRP